MPIAERCAKNFHYKRQHLDLDEMVAEAYFILCLVFLEGYSVPLDDPDFNNKLKSRIYRDLGNYIRPECRAKNVKVESYLTQNYQDKNYLGENGLVYHNREPTVDFAIPVFEILEILTKTELEMQVLNCLMKGVSNDEAIRSIVKIGVRRIQAIRNVIIDRLEHLNLETI